VHALLVLHLMLHLHALLLLLVRILHLLSLLVRLAERVVLILQRKQHQDGTSKHHFVIVKVQNQH
jgi:hypothetical protein